jgi:hypothetical protein
LVKEDEMETTVKKTWKPTTGGVLNIVSGGCYLLCALGVLIALVVIASVGSAVFLDEMWRELGRQGMGLSFLIFILGITSIFFLAIGILSLLGGIYALKRKNWGLALAGSIASFFGSSVLGILAIIFIAMSRDEFVSRS